LDASPSCPILDQRFPCSVAARTCPTHAPMYYTALPSSGQCSTEKHHHSRRKTRPCIIHPFVAHIHPSTNLAANLNIPTVHRNTRFKSVDPRGRCVDICNSYQYPVSSHSGENGSGLRKVASHGSLIVCAVSSSLRKRYKSRQTQSDTSRSLRHKPSSTFAVNQHPSPPFPFQTAPTCGSKVDRPGTGAEAIAPTIGCSKEAASCECFGSLQISRSPNGACDHDVSISEAGALLPMFRI
jgi:hypothetical protein